MRQNIRFLCSFCWTSKKSPKAKAKGSVKIGRIPSITRKLLGTSHDIFPFGIKLVHPAVTNEVVRIIMVLKCPPTSANLSSQHNSIKAVINQDTPGVTYGFFCYKYRDIDENHTGQTMSRHRAVKLANIIRINN